MSKPHKCPVCNGEGKLEIYEPVSTSFTKNFKTCGACGGTGVVWEPNSAEIFPEYIPPTWPHLPPYVPPYAPFSPKIEIVPLPGPHLPHVPTISPVVPLTFPKDFEFPKDVVENSNKKLLEIIENWRNEILKSLKEQLVTDDVTLINQPQVSPLSDEEKKILEEDEEKINNEKK